MSKSLKEEADEAGENLAYFEAEIASLKEELTYPTAEKRKAFVQLRVARLEKELPRIREKARLAQEHIDWHARMGQGGTRL